MNQFSIGTPIQLASNFFMIDFNEPIFKYTIAVESDKYLMSEQFQEVLKVFLSKSADNRKLVSETLGATYIILNGAVYSTRMSPFPIIINLPENDTDYEKFQAKKITIQSETRIDRANHPEIQNNLLGRFFKMLLKKIKLKQIGRKLFDPALSQQVNDFQIWPGFSTTFVMNSNAFLLNIDIASKIITSKFVDQIMTRLQRNAGQNFEDILNRELTGKSVMTNYNKRFYVIDGIAFQMNANSSFTNKDGVAQTFVDYYAKRYNVIIKSPNIPLIVSQDRKTKNIVYLVPELCCLTGLSEEDRSNRNLMKDIDAVTKLTGTRRLNNSMALLDMITQNQATFEYVREWKVGINREPITVTGAYIKPGSLLFHKKEVDIERSQNLDRDIQNKFFEQIDFNILCVFFPTTQKNDAQTFISNTQDVFNQYALRCNDIRPVEINQWNWNSVKQAIEKNLSQQVTACIWILPGAKGNGLLYKEIKTKLINECPVPSQMIVGRTISAGKNLRSIITKLYIQVCAKIGGIPWAINDLPFSNEPTMVIGMCHYKKSGSKFGIYSVVATTNPTFSKYWSSSVQASGNLSYQSFLESKLSLGLETFKNDNGILPFNIICLREGVPKGEEIKTKLVEVEVIRNLAMKIYEKNPQPKILYTVISRSTNAKFFLKANGSNENLQNPNAGTYLQEKISENENEFFLIAQKPKIGMSSPCGYRILENDMTTIDRKSVTYVREQLAKLIYKLSYLYYNTTGSIKVPAPIHYADKLATFIGDKSLPNMLITPHVFLGEIKSLFFI